MAKPDIQRAYITASGTLFRDDGKLGLEDKGPVTGLDLAALNVSNDIDAALAGVPLGGLYHDLGDVKVRLT